MRNQLLIVLLAAAAAGAGAVKLKLTSPAFSEGGTIPVDCTCDGTDRSPALEWGKAPAGTLEFAVICTDPDAPRGTFVHWVMADIPPSATGLVQGAGSDSKYVLGHNDFGSNGYRGPCPPKGKPHHYVFEVLALDRAVHLEAGVTREQLEKAVAGHVLARGKLTGLYQRR